MLAVNFLLLAAVLFCIGVFGVIARRNAVMVLMSIELILNAVNLNLVAFALMNNNQEGQVFALYVIANRRCRSRRRPRNGVDDLPQPKVDCPRRTFGNEGLKCSPQKKTYKSLELSSGWFMENAWLIALIPAVAFVLIIAFGKKMPFKGAEFGLASIGASLVIATGAGIQWMQRTDSRRPRR